MLISSLPDCCSQRGAGLGDKVLRVFQLGVDSAQQSTWESQLYNNDVKTWCIYVFMPKNGTPENYNVYTCYNKTWPFQNNIITRHDTVESWCQCFETLKPSWLSSVCLPQRARRGSKVIAILVVEAGIDESMIVDLFYIDGGEWLIVGKFVCSWRLIKTLGRGSCWRSIHWDISLWLKQNWQKRNSLKF